MSRSLDPSGVFSAMFCPDCGTILNLSSVSLTVACSHCNRMCDMESILSSVRVTESEPKVDFYSMLDDENDEDTRAIVHEQCPSCKHATAFFRTAQLRSADEGATVFYQCTSCGHQWSQNN